MVYFGILPLPIVVHSAYGINVKLMNVDFWCGMNVMFLTLIYLV